jgi:hypothetical protein
MELIYPIFKVNQCKIPNDLTLVDFLLQLKYWSLSCYHWEYEQVSECFSICQNLRSSATASSGCIIGLGYVLFSILEGYPARCSGDLFKDSVV